MISGMKDRFTKSLTWIRLLVTKHQTALLAIMAAILFVSSSFLYFKNPSFNAPPKVVHPSPPSKSNTNSPNSSSNKASYVTPKSAVALVAPSNSNDTSQVLGATTLKPQIKGVIDRDSQPAAGYE